MMSSPANPLPLVESLPQGCSPSYALERCWDLPYVCLMESALPGTPLGRYSFLVADPFHVWELNRPRADALAEVSQILSRFQSESLADLPPFQGGAAGILSYELGRSLEKIPRAKHDEFSLPLASLGFYDVVLAWDHERDEGWIISQGFPDTTPVARERRAASRLQLFRDRLNGPARPRPTPLHHPIATAHGLTANQYETRLGPSWLGTFDSLGYQAAVQKARDYIYAGDIFQVNIAQRLMRRAMSHAVDLYLELREVNAAPFAGYMDLGNSQVVSASPERFLQVQGRKVESRPIKGTRRRSQDPREDHRLASELLASEKDRAENTMIVDLLRNDLSRVCLPSSLRVPQLCQVETYPHVLHLVSAIEGELRPQATLTDLLSACFPGGSITGAPKVRAMEIIAELEPTVRGPYCGSLGYLGFDGVMDFNILIRTVTASRGWWQLQVGGGIVADSQPEAEEEETWTKAAGMIAGMERLQRV